jgi:Helix-turn-helix domain
MSIESIVWALNGAPIPRERRDASSLAVVLVGLANHADPDGRNAFPAVSTLVRYTRLSERTVRTCLDTLEALGLIRPSDPVIVAAYIKRADRRPQGWDLAVRTSYPQENNGVRSLHPDDSNGVQTRRHGVQAARERGAVVAPEPSLNRPGNRPSRERAPMGARTAGMTPPCGECDARPDDPISARIEWLDTAHTESRWCPRCHPRVSEVAR